MKPVGGQPGVAENTLDLLHQLGITSLAGSEINADERAGGTEVLPGPGLQTSQVQQSSAERHDQAGLLRDIDEKAGAQQAETRMPPTDQRFDTGHAVVRECHDRLVLENELVLLEGTGQHGGKGVTGDLMGVALGVEQRPPALAVGLGPIQRDIRGP